MKLELDTGGALYMIRGYSAEGILVNDLELRRSVIVMPDTLVTDWPPQCPAELTEEHIRTVAEMDAEVVILGTGRRTRFPPAAIMRPLIATSTGYEVMDTRSACRCYAVLAAEGRRVAVALLPPGAE